jgi:leucyl-tRNA synthetase
MSKYNHQELEQKWDNYWSEKQLYKTPELIDVKNKQYILPQLPYPSGAGLHMGHSETYVACDIYARYNRMIGKDVLQVIGWDAFGLPSENYAIKTGKHPKVNTEEAIDNFRSQIKGLGISVDWDREVGSHNPDYYKWTQWFFLLMIEQEMAYRKKQAVNWCENDKTVLANEQVEDGKCERCGTEVVQKEMEQWFFKITEYADRLYDDLDKVDWPAESVKRQRDWIGRSEGAEVKFQIRIPGSEADELGALEVFTTRPDTLFGATFMVIAPEHPLINQLVDQAVLNNSEEVVEYIKKASFMTELERQQQKEKTGVRIDGVVAVNPVNDTEIPVFVADYVLSGYGTGAIMAVPGHDARDWDFAKKYSLPIVSVVDGEGRNEDEPFVSKEGGVIINSDFLNGKTIDEAISTIISWLEEQGVGNVKKTFKLRDWSISRQRYWGSPIPMLYDEKGELHQVPKEDLPVILPDDVDVLPTGASPLRDSKDFHKGVEEKYGKGWRREVDTLDTFMDSSWYFFRYIDPHNDKAFASPEALKTWMPIDFYLGGPEHVNGHLLYSRFFTKVLYDAGYIDFDEPFMVHRHQGLVKGPDGRKMSKRWGNVVNPTDVVASYGGDTARMYLMFMGPLEQDKAWNDNAVQGVRRFVQRVYDFEPAANKAKSDKEVLTAMAKLAKKVTDDIPQLRFNTAISEFMKVINLFERQDINVAKDDWLSFVKLLAPFAPYVTEEVWQRFDSEESVHQQDWPTYDESLLKSDSQTIAVQVNGKVRDTIVIPSDATEDIAVELAKESEKIQSYLEAGDIIKVIYVQGRIMNLIIK